MRCRLMTAVRAIDVSALPKHFDAAAAEARWGAEWERRGIYHWTPGRPREECFVVDTPPPTVSGALHVGHVFSYTHTDVIVRYQRMRGRAVYYPMGWDDNGVPTERRVQNYYHVRCDPTLPPRGIADIAPPDAAAAKRPPRLVSRADFIELCGVLTRADEEAFKRLWTRLGLSVDWREEYATIDRRCRHLSQLSFRDLWEKGHVYSVEAPFMWDVDFEMAVSQAEVEDRVVRGAFYDVVFALEDGGEIVIATTRPELLPACVGVAVHPEDARYRGLVGRRAVTPLFHAPVPVFASAAVDREKGTGIVMVCTFGDQTDVQWWREHGLPLRQVLGRDGRLRLVRFGAEGWESLDAETANRHYADLLGQTTHGARQRIVELLRDSGALRSEPRGIEHAVKFYEKGDRPLEFLPTRQWFVRLLDKKAALLAKGDEIRWHPDHMRLRYRNWTENLGFDWCISRQRYFGVPIPVWYPLGRDGQPDHDRPIVAERAQLPVDPMTDVPPGYRSEQRDRPGGFTADRDVFDTWFTSSLTPQIGSHWLLDPARHARLFPADIRPQAHDIIRTWAFYTIAKALLHENTVPWRHVVISGWILDPDRKKMSKSKGNVVTPMHLLEQYGADSVRYWAASARLGTDTAFDEKVMKVGKRLVTKIFNAGKFVLGHGAASAGPVAAELDRAFVARLRELVARTTALLDEFDYAHALQETETFFWQSFTDSFLELAKVRARDGDPSAVAALRLGLSVLLRLFAPTLPYITEEVWSWAFAAETGAPTVHRAPWPSAGELAHVPPPDDPESFAVAVAAQAAINRAKSENQVSIGRGVSEVVLAAHPDTLERLGRVLADVRAATRTALVHDAPRPAAPVGAVEVERISFAPPEASPPPA